MNTTPHTLTARDLIFAAINGGVFGLGFAIVSNNAIPFFPQLPFIITALAFSILAAIGVAVGAALARWKYFFFQLAKFGIVGVANTAVDLGTFNLLLMLVGGSGTPALIATFKAISFSVAVFNSYIWNRYWSFEKGGKASIGEFGAFVLVSVIGLGINAGVTVLVATLAAHGGLISSTLATVAAAIASIVGLLWNFLGYKLLVFKK